MEQIFNRFIDSTLGAPHMIYVSFIIAAALVIGGVVLLINCRKLKDRRWPGITCTLLGCASLVTTSIQYFL